MAVFLSPLLGTPAWTGQAGVPAFLGAHMPEFQCCAILPGVTVAGPGDAHERDQVRHAPEQLQPPTPHIERGGPSLGR